MLKKGIFMNSEQIKIKIRTARVKFLKSAETNLKVIYWLLTQKIY